MKTLLIALATGSLMLAACSSSKPEEAAAPRITVEEAMTQCQQASGENADRAVFDACMKGKGYQRTAESAASEPAASEPVADSETAAPEVAASEPAAKAAPAKKAAKKAKNKLHKIQGSHLSSILRMKTDLEQLENKGRLNIFQTAFVFYV